MEIKQKDDAREAASRLVKNIQHAELQGNDVAWCDSAAALVSHVHTQVGGCLSRKWQLTAEAALVIPALVAVLSHRAVTPILKLHAVEALRLSVCTNDANQQIACSAVTALVDTISTPPPPPPLSEGPKAASVAKGIAEQLRDAALEALSELVFMHRASQDAALAADIINHLMLFINCVGPHSANPSATQARALRVLANLTRSNVMMPVSAWLMHNYDHAIILSVSFLLCLGSHLPERWKQLPRRVQRAPCRRS
jgi:hypothetical protein